VNLSTRKDLILVAIIAVVGLLIYTWWTSRPKASVNLLEGADDLAGRLGALGAAVATGQVQAPDLGATGAGIIAAGPLGIYGPNTGIMPPILIGRVPTGVIA
jgi:hypothetical protein